MDNQGFMVMEDFDLTIALNGNNMDVKVHPYAEGDITRYDILFENYTLTVYKNTLYTWASDDPHGLSHADIQSIGEQITNAD